MTPEGWWAVALLGTTAVHAGFQVTVTAVVYPAFVRVPAGAWPAFHAGHSRGIAPLVAVVYGATILACVGSAVVGPRPGGLWLAVAGTVLALGTTAAVAAPLHGRLGAGPDPDLIGRLRRADAVRTVGALVALVGAVATAGSA